MSRSVVAPMLVLTVTLCVSGCLLEGGAIDSRSPSAPDSGLREAAGSMDRLAAVASAEDAHAWSIIVSDGERLLSIPVRVGATPTILFTFKESQTFTIAGLSSDGSRVAVLGPDLSIHLVEVDGGTTEQIAGPLEGDVDRRGRLQWSPDGAWLAWIEDGDLMVRGADGEARRITDVGQVRDYAWAPNGEQLAVCMRDEEELDAGLWTVHRSGDDLTQVAPVSDSIHAASFPGYSPDGETIAFCRAWESGTLCFASARGEGHRLDVGPAIGTLHWLEDGSGVLYDAAINEVESEGIAFCAPDGRPQSVSDASVLWFDATAGGDLVFMTEEGAAVQVNVIEDAMSERRSLPVRSVALPWAKCAWRPDGGAIAVWCEQPGASSLLVGGREGAFAELTDAVATFVGWVRPREHGKV